VTTRGPFSLRVECSICRWAPRRPSMRRLSWSDAAGEWWCGFCVERCKLEDPRQLTFGHYAGLPVVDEAAS